MTDLTTDAPQSTTGAVNPADTSNDTIAYKLGDLARYKRLVEDAQYGTFEARLQCEIDDDYYNSFQWTREERLALAERHQPDNVFNVLRLAVNGTLGVLRQSQSDPRCYPRNPGNEDQADVASKTLRFIADKAKFKPLKLDMAKDYWVQGTGAVIIEVDADNVPVLTQIRWEEFFYDPRSRRKDFADARYKGIAKWMYADDVEGLYPTFGGEIQSAVAAGGGPTPISDVTFQDRPNVIAPMSWVDQGKRRIMLIELYERRGPDWFRCVFYSGGILEEDKSPYQDERGRSMCPIEAQSCYVDRQNARSGPVRDMRGPQDEINKRHSKILHLLNTRQVQETQLGSGMGSIEDVRKEVARPDGVIPTGWEIIRNDDIVQGQVEMLTLAQQFIERFAPSPAILGRQGADASGRSTLLRQQAGLTELGVNLGGIEDWELRVYRQMWARAKQYWTAPDWIRVTDDQGTPQFVGINQPVGAPVVHPITQQPMVDAQTGQPAEGQPQFDGNGQSVFGYRNKLADLDIDIIVDTVPDTANIQAEQFQVLAELAKMYPQQVQFTDLLECSSMPNKRQIVDNIKQRQEQQQPPQMNALQTATVKKILSEAELNLTEAFTNMAAAAAAGTVTGMGPPAQAVNAPQAAPGQPAVSLPPIAAPGLPPHALPPGPSIPPLQHPALPQAPRPGGPQQATAPPPKQAAGAPMFGHPAPSTTH